MFDQLKISKAHIKVFCLAFVPMFIIVVLQHLGVKSNLFQQVKAQISIEKPIPDDKNVIDEIKPILEKKKPEFEIKKETSFVRQTYADSGLLAEQANAYLVIDMDSGKVLAEKNSETEFAIASITKVMTSVVALDLANPEELFPIDQTAAAVEPSIIGVTQGEKLTVDELLRGALLSSGNDAAEALRDGIDLKYNQKIFIDAMNEKAKIIGMNNTRFTNPQGYDYGRSYSTAIDVARLTQYALTQYPLIDEIVKLDYYYLPENQNHKEFKLYNWNGLIGVYPDTMGVKIGNTGRAGKTTVVVSNRNGKKIMAVLLGAPDIKERDLWTAELLDLGYQKALGLTPVNITEDQLLAKYASWYY